MRGNSLVLLAAVALRADFCVAPGGNDANPGTPEAPFATLERARDAVRAARTESDGPVTVWLRGGTYNLSATFTLGAADSGSAGATVTYSAWPGERVTLTGGREVTGFAAVRDAAILARLDPRARNAVLVCDLRQNGITDFGRLRRRGMGLAVQPAALELFVDDRALPLARWPNLGWAMIASVPAGQNGGRFRYEGDRPSRWAASAGDLWVHGYWTYDWADSYEKVASIDTAAREIATAAPHGVYGYTAARRWRALNVLEELDEPGEWYLDRNTGMLYLWPPEVIGSPHAWVSLLETPLISLQNTSYVILRDLHLRYTRGNGIEISGGAHNAVVGCSLRNIGARGVSISGTDNGVMLSEISATGEGAINLSGGDRITLTPAANYAIGNHIHNFSRWVRTYRPAVQLQGVGHVVTRNLIHHAPHNAVQLSGNDHLIQANEIHSVAMETGDVGAYYMGRDWTMRGNRILDNIFRNLGNGDVNGVYLDDCASGTLVSGNYFHRAGRCTFIGGGRDNIVANNTYVDCDPAAVQVDARGLTWATKWFDGTDSTLMDRLKAMPYQKPPWSERYPELVNILNDDPAVPKGNAVTGNTYTGKWINLRDNTAKWVRVEDNRTPAAGDEPLAGTGAETEVVRAVLSAAGRLTIENLGRTAASGEYRPWSWPEAEISPAAVSFSLNPGETATTDITVRSSKSVTVGIHRRGEDLHPAGVTIKP